MLLRLGVIFIFLLTSKFFNISIYPAKGLYIYNPRCRAGAKVWGGSDQGVTGCYSLLRLILIHSRTCFYSNTRLSSLVNRVLQFCVYPESTCHFGVVAAWSSESCNGPAHWLLVSVAMTLPYDVTSEKGACEFLIQGFIWILAIILKNLFLTVLIGEKATYYGG